MQTSAALQGSDSCPAHAGRRGQLMHAHQGLSERGQTCGTWPSEIGSGPQRQRLMEGTGCRRGS